jgi:hypothetical protein
MRLMWLLVGLMLLLAAVAAGLYTYRGHQRIRIELKAARLEMAAGRHAAARVRLIKLTDSATSQDEVWYHLGVCEEARGHPDAA